MVEWLHVYCPNVLPYNAIVEAAKTGSVHLLEWLADRHESVKWIPGMMDAAASTGQIKTLEWLHKHSKTVRCTNAAMLSAIECRHLETVKWLHTHVGVFELDEEYLGRVAIRSGDRAGKVSVRPSSAGRA